MSYLYRLCFYILAVNLSAKKKEEEKNQAVAFLCYLASIAAMLYVCLAILVSLMGLQ